MEKAVSTQNPMVCHRKYRIGIGWVRVELTASKWNVDGGGAGEKGETNAHTHKRNRAKAESRTNPRNFSFQSADASVLPSSSPMSKPSSISYVSNSETHASTVSERISCIKARSE